MFLIFNNMQWDVQEPMFLQSLNRSVYGEVCAARAAVCCCLSLDSGSLSHSKAAAHTHTHIHAYCLRLLWASRMQERREKRRCFDSLLPFCCQSNGLHFHPGKKRLVQQTVRICEGWEEGRKVKAKNERNRKTTYRKKFIGQARKQSKKGGCCRVVSELTVKPQWPKFFWTRQATIRRVTQVFNFLCGFL